MIDATSVNIQGYWYIIALILAVGILVAQYRRGVVRELRESLSTAEKEIGIHRGIVERLEKKISVIENRCSAMEAENVTLREILATGTHLAPIVREEFDRFKRDVDEKHREMATHLQEPERTALLRALAHEGR